MGDPMAGISDEREPKRLAVDVEGLITKAVQQASEVAAMKASEMAVAKCMAKCEEIAEKTAERVCNRMMAKNTEDTAKMEERLNELEKWKVRSTTASSAGGAPSTVGAMSGPRFAGPPAVPTYVELKGWVVDWDNPDATALTQTQAKQLLDHMMQSLPDEAKNNVDEARTRRLQTRVLLKKVLLYLKPGCTRDDAWSLRHAALEVFKRSPHYTSYYAMVEPEAQRKPLLAQSAKIHQLMRDSGIGKENYNLETSVPQARVTARWLGGDRPEQYAVYTASAGWSVRSEVWARMRATIPVEDATQRLRQ